MMARISVDLADELLTFKPLSNSDGCKGLFFRGRVNAFQNSKGVFIYQERLIPLKKLSCDPDECAGCGYMLENFREQLSYDSELWFGEIKEGGLYRLDVVEEHTDWETGISEGCDFGFIKIEEQKDASL